jgi:RHS repeat-associated protein
LWLGTATEGVLRWNPDDNSAANFQPTPEEDRDPTPTDPFAPAFDPGGAFQSAWLSLAQPPLRRSVDGPRSDLADVTSYVYYPVDPSVPATLRGRLAAIRNAAGHITRYENYDVFGNATRIVDPNGVATEMTYDSLGRLLTTTIKAVPGCDTTKDALCNTDLAPSRTYKETSGPLETEQRAGGGVTKYEYDSRGRVTAVSRGTTTNSLYEQLVTTYDGDTGLKINEAFKANENGSWVEKTSTAYAYDTLGQLQTLTTFTIAEPNETITATVAYTYDAAGRLASVRDENHDAANTTYAYDPAGRVATVTQTLSTASGGSITTQYSYDIHGNLTGVTDPNGNLTQYTFDDFGRIMTQVSPVTGTTRYEYDGAGNLTRTIDANQMMIERTYDALNRPLTAVSSKLSGSQSPPPSRGEEPSSPSPALPSPEVVQWAYDDATANAFAIGRLATMTDPVGVTTYQYERRGLLRLESRTITTCLTTRDSGTQCTAGRTDLTRYAYDADGNRNKIIYPSGALTVDYTHDYAGRPLTASGYVLSAAYLPFGPLTKIQFANGTTQTFTYDHRYRMTSNNLSLDGLPPGQPGIIAWYKYEYDKASNITRIGDMKEGDYSRRFFYDDLNRLTLAMTSEDTPARRSPLWGKAEYTWDNMGNILRTSLAEVEPGGPEELLATNPKKFQPPNRKRTNAVIVAPLGRVNTFDYSGTTPVITAVTLNDLSRPVNHDSAGNELHYVVNRKYSARNLLEEVIDDNDPGELFPHEVAYGYDGRGLRVLRAEFPSNDAGTVARRSYVYTPELRLLSMTRNDTTNVWEDAEPQPAVGNNVHHEIVWFGDRPVGQYDPGLPTRYTFTDHLGRPLLQTDATATIIWRVEYEPFGNVYDVREGLRTDQPLRLPGQELGMTWDGPEESYNIFRWYRSGWGRYNVSDPAGLQGNANAYSYAASNPLKFLDPLGLVTVIWNHAPDETITRTQFRDRFFGGLGGQNAKAGTLASRQVDCKCSGHFPCVRMSVTIKVGYKFVFTTDDENDPNWPPIWQQAIEETIHLWQLQESTLELSHLAEAHEKQLYYTLAGCELDCWLRNHSWLTKWLPGFTEKLPGLNPHPGED